MAGRHAKPIGLHIADGNPGRLTKEEIRRRQETEVKLGAEELAKVKAPPMVTKDKIAKRHWSGLMKDYKAAAANGVELLTSADIGVLAMYCRTYAEYEYLLDARQKVQEIEIDSDVFRKYFNHILEMADVSDSDPAVFGLRAQQHLSQLATIDGVLKIETAINKKMDSLLKMQDRLFLNPLARVKNVPKSPAKPKDEPTSKFGKFGGTRSG